MKTKKTNHGKSVLALIALIVSLATTGTVLGCDGGGLEITPELTAQWWQWAFSIPSSVHPLTLKAADLTGADYCMVGQQGGEWFLGGIFKVVDVDNPPGPVNGVQVVDRKCEIPLGKTILIPVLNAECDTAGELALGNVVPQDLLKKTRYLRECAKTVADAVDKDTAEAYFGPVDSSGNWTQNPIKVKRVHTVLPFSITYSPENIMSSDCPGGFLCEPNPNPSLTQADGYWVQVQPQKPGTYKLQTFGKAPAYDFALRVTYTLTVVGPKDQ